MCKFGDIIVVEKFKGEDGKDINKHSFIVIDDVGGTISGLDYSFVASVMSSFKNNKKKKLSYIGNVLLPKDALNDKKLKKESYVKADKAFYFKKDKIDYYIIGKLKDEYLINLLKITFSLSINGKLNLILDNLY